MPSYEPAWAFGGTVTATSQLCRGLASQGVDISVYTTDADGKGGYLDVPLNKAIDLGGVKVTYFHCDFGMRKAFYSRGLKRKLKQNINEFDLIHVAAVWQWIQVDVSKICKYLQKPYLVSTHGSFNPWPWNQNVLQKRLYWHLFGKKTIKRTNAIHFTTEDERDKSLATVPLLKETHNFIVPNGINIGSIIKNKNIRENLQIAKEKIVLLFIGRIHRVKGIHFILEALKKLNIRNIAFLIVGNKEDLDYVNQLKKLSNQLGESIIWLDSIPREEIWDYYYSSDLFVLTSCSENFGIVAAEAMSCGLPVLISNNVGIWREVKADNAGFVVNQDVDEIADVLKKCIEKPGLLQQLSLNARKSAERRYDIDKVADLMIKAYEDILIGRRSPELQWK